MVVSLTEPNDSGSLLRDRVTVRSTVSPGTRLVASIKRPRTPAAEFITTLPVLTVSLAEVVEVNEP